MSATSICAVVSHCVCTMYMCMHVLPCISFCIHYHIPVAACDLIYLGSMDVGGPGNESVLAETVQLMKGLPPNINIVTFKASKDGITLTDNSSSG